MYHLPDVVTHNFDPMRGPFKNICNLTDHEAEKVLDEIRALGKSNLKPTYLARRRETEAWLLTERTKKLGPPHLRHPIYCFLGDFNDGLDATRPQSLVMPLTAFPPEILTFTYPDSTASLPLAISEEHHAYRKSHHGQVFTLDEIKQVVAEFGMPLKRWQTDPAMRYDRFIEVQVWDNRPLRQFAIEGQLHPQWVTDSPLPL